MASKSPETGIYGRIMVTKAKHPEPLFYQNIDKLRDQQRYRYQKTREHSSLRPSTSKLPLRTLTRTQPLIYRPLSNRA